MHALSHADKPARIVSLDLCTDWMLLKYAEQDQVIAFSPLLYRYTTDWVPDHLPTHSGRLEHIVSLKPDLVITGEFNAMQLRKRLQQLGIGVEVLSLPTRLQQLQPYLQHLSELVGDTSGRATEMHVNQNKEKASGNTLLLLGANGIGTGRGTLEHDMLTAAGWTNYLKKSGYIQLQLEQLVQNPPHAILWSAPQTRSLANLFAQHPAIHDLVIERSSHVNQHWRWQCPGPWSYELIEEIRSWND